MSLTSKTSIARPGSPSLRATIPEGCVAFLNLKEGEKLEWYMDIDDETGERMLTIKKPKVKQQ